MKMRRMRGACWISKATCASAQTEICSTYCFFHVNGGFVNAPHCYVIVHCWPCSCHGRSNRSSCCSVIAVFLRITSTRFYSCRFLIATISDFRCGVRSSLFFDVTQRRVVVMVVLGQHIDFRLQGSSSRLSRSVCNYQSTLRNIPEERSVGGTKIYSPLWRHLIVLLPRSGTKTHVSVHAVTPETHGGRTGSSTATAVTPNDSVFREFRCKVPNTT
jgi:hypothetical protein